MEVLDYIAENTCGSVRELEGIVMGLFTRSISLNLPITLDLARTVMRTSVRSETRHINFDMVVDATAEYFGLSPDVIFSKSRIRDISDARMVAMYLGSKLTGLSAKAISRRLGRQHSTILHGIKTVKERMPFTRDLAKAVEIIETELKK